MKKLTLSIALCLAVFGTTSQASNSNAQTTKQTAEAAAPVANTEAKPEEKAKSPISPQVQKLIGLHPRLVARIQPRGRVCFDGEDCDVTISVLSAATDGQPRDGKTIYGAVCKTCHEAGLVGSPKFGDKGAWAPRIAKGKDLLYKHAIGGFNAMPAKGGADIADEEVINAVDYMISQSS